MPAVLVQVADAVTALLNTVDTFSQKFTAKRTYPTWKVPLTKICGLRVDVVATSHPSSELFTRGRSKFGCRLIVVLRQKFGQDKRQEETEDGRPISNEAIDALVLLVEEIHDYLCSPTIHRLTNSTGLEATWEGTNILQTFDEKHLQDNAQFTAAIQLEYRATSAL